MPSTKKKVTGKKLKVKVTLAQKIADIQIKFTELKKLRKRLTGLKGLYVKHNELMEELMPLFIEVSTDQIIMKRELTIGNKKYRFNPFFYDEKKARVVPKVWTSCAFESGTIE